VAFMAAHADWDAVTTTKSGASEGPRLRVRRPVRTPCTPPRSVHRCSRAVLAGAFRSSARTSASRRVSTSSRALRRRCLPRSSERDRRAARTLRGLACRSLSAPDANDVTVLAESLAVVRSPASVLLLTDGRTVWAERGGRFAHAGPGKCAVVPGGHRSWVLWRMGWRHAAPRRGCGRGRLALARPGAVHVGGPVLVRPTASA
jgi:hypothetical protein